MRKIIIHQNESQKIEIVDDSDEPLDEYCNRLSSLMKMGNVAILKTSSASVILRPSKVVGIQVEDDASLQQEPLPITPPEESKAEPKKEIEDIITDV